MLRRLSWRRAPGGPVTDAPRASEDVEPHEAPRPRRWRTRRIALGVLLALVLATGAAYTQKDRYTDDLADLSRRVIGDENTARLESWYFRVQDRIDRVKYRVFGGETNPFGDRVVVQYLPAKPARVITIDLSSPPAGPIDVPDLPPAPPVPVRPPPLVLPETVALREDLEQGEGVWTTSGLPRSGPDDVLMAKTFIRPDPSRPYALVGILLLDRRRVQLHMTGGYEDPGGDRGVEGPGTIPEERYPDLLVAWNGGFKGPHGGFGMVADGLTYRPLRDGLASVAVLADGTMQIGEWGRTLAWSDAMIAVRQNAALLVENCEVSPRTSEGNDTWGYVQVDSTEFITWRSAIGLTKEGNLLVAAGNALSAETLAKALWAAGACTAMQLDINSPYVLTSLYFAQPDGRPRAERFMDAMPDSPGRFFNRQPRDFFWVTLGAPP